LKTHSDGVIPVSRGECFAVPLGSLQLPLKPEARYFQLATPAIVVAGALVLRGSWQPSGSTIMVWLPRKLPTPWLRPRVFPGILPWGALGVWPQVGAGHGPLLLQVLVAALQPPPALPQSSSEAPLHHLPALSLCGVHRRLEPD